MTQAFVNKRLTERELIKMLLELDIINFKTAQQFFYNELYTDFWVAS